MQWCFAVFLSIFVLLTNPLRVYAHEVPSFDGPVNDFAGVLQDDKEQILEAELVSYAQQEKGAEIAVVTIESLDGEPVEDRALEFFDTWKIGKTKQDNGLLILIAVKDRELRIQTGYGVEPVLPDSVVNRIIQQDMAPLLRTNDYIGAVEIAVDRVQAAINRDDAGISGQTSEAMTSLQTLTGGGIGEVFIPLLLGLAAAMVSYGAAFLGRTKSWWLGGVIGAIAGILLSGAIAMVVVGIIGLLLDYILSRNYQKWSSEGKHTGWAKSFGGFHSTGYRSGSSSSKSFSFGGGRSGGGGASGKW